MLINAYLQILLNHLNYWYEIKKLLAAHIGFWLLSNTLRHNNFKELNNETINFRYFINSGY